MAREFSKKFYKSKAWKDFRESFFNSKFGMCERCDRPGEEVHHKIYLTLENISDPKIALGYDNCELLCKKCHNAEHNKSYMMHRTNKVINYKQGDGLYAFDKHGDLIKNKNIFIVHGSPASGKTKYVRENKGKYDIVVDLDYIRASLTLSKIKSDIPDVLPFALEVRELMYSLIEQRKYHIEKAWVIATLPFKEDRLELASRLKAELIHIDTDKDTCLNYSMNDKERLDSNNQTRIINNYFEKYEK